MKIDLTINKGFQWHQKKNVFVKGFYLIQIIFFMQKKSFWLFLDIKVKMILNKNLKQPMVSF